MSDRDRHRRRLRRWQRHGYRLCRQRSKGKSTSTPADPQVIICGRRMDTLQTTADELNAAAKESGNGGELYLIAAN